MRASCAGLSSRSRWPHLHHPGEYSQFCEVVWQHGRIFEDGAEACDPQRRGIGVTIEEAPALHGASPRLAANRVVRMALIAAFVSLADVSDHRVRGLLLRLQGRRKRIFRLDRNRVAFSLDVSSDCVLLH